MSTLSNTPSDVISLYFKRAAAARAALAAWEKTITAVRAAVKPPPGLPDNQHGSAWLAGVAASVSAAESIAAAEAAAAAATDSAASPARVLAAAVAEAAAAEAAAAMLAVAAADAGDPARRAALARNYSPSLVDTADRAVHNASLAATAAAAASGAALRIAAAAGAAFGADAAAVASDAALMAAAVAGGRPVELLMGALECASATSATLSTLRDFAVAAPAAGSAAPAVGNTAGLAYAAPWRFPRKRVAGEQFIDARALGATGAAYDPSAIIAGRTPGGQAIESGAVLTEEIVARLRTIYTVAAGSGTDPDAVTPAAAVGPVLVSADGGATVAAVGAAGGRAWAPLGGPAPRALRVAALAAEVADAAAARDTARWGGLAPAFEAAAEAAPAPVTPSMLAHSLVSQFVESLAAEKTGSGPVSQPGDVKPKPAKPKHELADESAAGFALAVRGAGGTVPGYVTAAVADVVAAEHAADVRALSARAGRAARVPQAAAERELALGRLITIRNAAGALKKRVGAAFRQPAAATWARPTAARHAALVSEFTQIVTAALAVPVGGEPFLLSEGRNFLEWALVSAPSESFATGGGGDGLPQPDGDGGLPQPGGDGELPQPGSDDGLPQPGGGWAELAGDLSE
jgi:hypothetical protein